jgi:hypothetical protein
MHQKKKVTGFLLKHKLKYKLNGVSFIIFSGRNVLKMNGKFRLLPLILCSNKISGQLVSHFYGRS